MTATEKGFGSEICSSWPRPIFGSLHKVSDLSCHGWHTILIAEMVVASKTIRSNSSGLSIGAVPQGSTLEDDFRNEQEDDGQNGMKRTAEDRRGIGMLNPLKSTSNLTESSCPEWLLQELENAEFIPIPESPGDPAKLLTYSCQETLPYEKLKEMKTAVNLPGESEKSKLPMAKNPVSEDCSHFATSPCLCRDLQDELGRVQQMLTQCLTQQQSEQEEREKLSAEIQRLSKEVGAVSQLQDNLTKKQKTIDCLEKQLQVQLEESHRLWSAIEELKTRRLDSDGKEMSDSLAVLRVKPTVISTSCLQSASSDIDSKPGTDSSLDTSLAAASPSGSFCQIE
ncbi:serine/threonine-protein kinase Nek9-like isoform X2 [Rhincodon typus]|uniref:serine/threonine-protein kinase Nek9-like isoform X2 n=1 Tax=Rhincodon typus TaxID=259920 RepID=UPI00202EC504|nr:serine/threonine-protein kinase Nek9-like isoform X2 [Rhincodon typus]